MIATLILAAIGVACGYGFVFWRDEPDIADLTRPGEIIPMPEAMNFSAWRAAEINERLGDP